MMRGFNDTDNYDTNQERGDAFLEACHDFDEESLVPKLFNQFEKTHNVNPSYEHLLKHFGLSPELTQKLIRICQKRSAIGLNLI